MDVNVCLCDFVNGFKASRFAIEVRKHNENTDSVFSKIATKSGVSENELEVVYCGQKLQRNKMLEALNLTTQSTLYAIRKAALPSRNVSSVHMADEVTSVIHKALKRPNFKKTIDQILTSQESLQKLAKAVPGIEKDPAALSMLQDPDLLQMLTNHSTVHKVLKEHPSFGPVAVYVAKIVDEEYTRNPNCSSRQLVYALDQMSDEEDEGNQTAQRGAVGGAPQQQITVSQVAAALAAATASAAQPSTSGTSAAQPAAGSSSSASTTSALVHDFFRQRVMTAQNSALEAQLQQLRDMGITDEIVARQALTVSQGDLQAALELLFDDNNA